MPHSSLLASDFCTNCLLPLTFKMLHIQLEIESELVQVLTFFPLVDKSEAVMVWTSAGALQ